MRVSIQHKTSRGKDWLPGFTGTVLYADPKVILVRGGGGYQVFRKGEPWVVSVSKKHPAAKLRGSFRLDPRSLKRVQDHPDMWPPASALKKAFEQVDRSAREHAKKR